MTLTKLLIPALVITALASKAQEGDAGVPPAGETPAAEPAAPAPPAEVPEPTPTDPAPPTQPTTPPPPPVPQDPARAAADLESRLSQSLDSSDDAGRIMLQLIEIYHKEGHLFGLIRTARRFANSQPTHPRHKEVMRRLIEGMEIASRPDEALATIRQFLARYGSDTQDAATVERTMAKLLERQGNQAEAAENFRSVWNRLKAPAGTADGIDALRLYRGLQTNRGSQSAAILADEMIDLLPADTISAAIGLQGFHAARRYNNWTQANAIGIKILQKNLPLDQSESYDLNRLMGENYAARSQFTNAVDHFKKALAITESDEVRRQLVRAMFRAGNSPEEISAAANDYSDKYPSRGDRWEVQSLVAHAYQAAGNRAKALDTAEAIFPKDAVNDLLLAPYLKWIDEDRADYPRAEKALLNAIAQNDTNAWRLRWALAFGLYRDRIKDGAKAGSATRDLLYENPADVGDLTWALAWLLDAANDEETFQAEVDRYLATAKKHAHFTHYRDLHKTWLEGALRDPARKARAEYMQARADAFRDTDEIRLWIRSEGNGPMARSGRAKLLETDLTPEQRKLTLLRQADDLQHRGDTAERAQSVTLFAELSAGNKDDYGINRSYLDAAANHGSAEQATAAANAVMRLQPTWNDDHTWRNLFRAAAKAKDPALARAALAWADRSQKANGTKMDAAAEIGDLLDAQGLTSEALGYWQSHITADPGHPEAVLCAGRVIEKGEATANINFLKPLAGRASDNHGAYAAWLADLYLEAGDLNQFKATLVTSRTLQDVRPFSPWGMPEFPPQDWVDDAQQSPDMSAATRDAILRSVADLSFGRTSATALLAQVASPATANAMPAMDRLRIYHHATMLAGKQQPDWDRLWPFAQAAMARDENSEASVLLTGMIQNIGTDNADQLAEARELVRKTYARMGGSGLEVARDSPIAPLLEIGLHLRLGDRAAALESYRELKTIFDEHYLDAPVDILLFAAESDMREADEQAHLRIEEFLRGWLVKHSESIDVSTAEKAKVQLFLARNYDFAGRHEVARAEYTTVLNRYKGSPEALEAQFGIGETFMAQKVYDQADEIFTMLADSPLPKTRLRAQFLLGVLASKQGNRDEARRIFRDVLLTIPDEELANQTLFNLAEVYGYEQRYLDQLSLLRTVGRLGRESKRWHVPGHALAIVVQDTDLGISRGHTRIPVQVRTEPGGDIEATYISSGGAGKGLFMGEITSKLGGAETGNGLLEVMGSDVIRVDYPEEFKKEFQFDIASNNEIRIAADGEFDMASARIIKQDDERFTDEIAREAAAAEEEEVPDFRKSAQRPTSEVKPGNLIYFRIEDPDKNVTPDTDRVTVKLTATSGDKVQAEATETGPHTGVFEGTVNTAELPAGALASDTAIDHSPLMAIDNNPETTWISEPDGITPKWLKVDLKEPKEITQIVLRSPNPDRQIPVRMTVTGSHDGRFWYELATLPKKDSPKPPPGEFGRMTRRVYKLGEKSVASWDDVLSTVAGSAPVSEEQVDSLEWSQEQPSADAALTEPLPPVPGAVAPESTPELAEAHGVLWQGKLVQPRPGAMRINVGGTAAIMIDGQLVLPFPKRDAEGALIPGSGSTNVGGIDILLGHGLHNIAIFAVVEDPGAGGITITRARENPNTPAITMVPFQVEDFDLESEDAKQLSDVEQKAPGSLFSEGPGLWRFVVDPIKVRHLRFDVDEIVGEAVAFNHIEVVGPGGKYIPTQADVLELARNDVLELSPGDTITGTYVDEITAGGIVRNKLLTRNLTATFFNGSINPLSYDVVKNNDGTMSTRSKELMRVDPGDRILLEVVDYDLDTTGGRDEIEVEVQVDTQDPLKLTATETEPNSGVFKVEVDTCAAETPEQGKLGIKIGNRIYLTYLDSQNTFPGHKWHRESTVYVRAPSDGTMRIVETRTSPGGGGAIFLPPPARGEEDPDRIKGVAYGVPLTVEVIDADRAKDSGSKIKVDLALDGSDAPPVTIECVISAAHAPMPPALAEMRSPALYQGRFVGQIVLQLGGPDSPRLIPAEEGVPAGVIGNVILPKDDPVEGVGDDIFDELDESEPLPVQNTQANMATVFNITGESIMAVRYDEVERRIGDPAPLSDRARMLSDGMLALTDENYDEPAEILRMGERVYVKVADPDLDISDQRDRATIALSTGHGENETVEIEETLSHSGVFTGSFELRPQEKPTPGNIREEAPEIEGFFGDTLTAAYVDERPASQVEPVSHSAELPIAVGTDGAVNAFSKIYGDEELAVQTQFHVAESYYELFKGHLKLERTAEAERSLENGRRTLRELAEDYPDPKHIPRISYLHGQFSQEMKEWEDAIESYKLVVRDYPDHPLAADAQYKLGQAYEESKRFDEALDAYVALAASYPSSPLIPNVMIRINDNFYRDEEFVVAAAVGEKFMERFPDHEHAPRMGFRVGQCFYKAEDYRRAGTAFDEFIKIYPDDELTSMGYFWAGESYRMANDVPNAFRRYNNCRWNFPESEAAKYSRGRLALPEMLAQFEREANVEE